MWQFCWLTLITGYTGRLKNSKILEPDVALTYKKEIISINTSPDIKYQFFKNKIKTLDSIIYTHEHADQTAGIFEMRPFY